MKKFNQLLLLLCALSLLGCASVPQNEFTYFSQKADFNIAQISVDKISIIGIIDDSKTLSNKQKQQVTQQVFNAFANRVDADNLIDTERLALQIGVNNYHQLKQLASNENFNQFAQLASQLNTTRYLLIIRLTNNTDHGAQQQLNGFLDDCNYYGRSIGLTMRIIDRTNGAEIWGGHLNKSNKTNSCHNDISWGNSNSNSNNNNEKESLAWLAALLVVSAITSDDASNNTLGGLDPLFNETINKFAQKLPSFYH